MRPDDIRAFAARDWTRLAKAKRTSWLQRKQHRSPAEILAIADALRRHARVIRPDWPSPRERDADLAAHQRLAEALRATRQPW
jgi:hypothetical protein